MLGYGVTTLSPKIRLGVRVFGEVRGSNCFCFLFSAFGMKPFVPSSFILYLCPTVSGADHRLCG